MLAVAACGNRTSPATSSTAATPPSGGSAAPESPAANRVDPDPATTARGRFADDQDSDGVVDKCDQCADSKEDFNGLDDLDGCIDTIDDQVAEHPSNRYVAPIVFFDFAPTSTTPSTPFVKWEIPDDVEAIACVGIARDDVAVAQARAKRLCDHLRSYLASTRPQLQIVELASSIRPTYRRENGAFYGANGELRVLRAAGVELWRRDGDQLVEITPRKTKHPRPVTPECRAMPPTDEFHRNVRPY